MPDALGATVHWKTDKGLRPRTVCTADPWSYAEIGAYMREQLEKEGLFVFGPRAAWVFDVPMQGGQPNWLLAKGRPMRRVPAEAFGPLRRRVEQGMLGQ